MKYAFANNYRSKFAELLNIPSLSDAELHQILKMSGVISDIHKDRNNNSRTFYRWDDLERLTHNQTITGINRLVSLQTLYNSANKLGLIDNEEEISNSLNQSNKEYDLDWKDGKNMEDTSQKLLKQNENKIKKITIKESIFKKLFK